MSIFKDMDLIYDLKMLKEGKDSPLKERYLSYIERMDADDRKAFDTFYAPIIEDFYKRDLKGKELAEWKYQRYMRDYAKVVKSLDDNVGRVLDYLKEKDMLDNTLVVYTSDQGFIWANTVGSTSVSCTKSPCTRRLLCTCPKGWMHAATLRNWYRT